MPDATYREFPVLFLSQGIVARKVEDVTEIHEMLNMDNCEELAEGAYATRLGSTIVNAQGTIGQPVYPLSGSVKSLFKLGQLGSNYFRYAVTSDGSLWRISGLNPGQWTKISSSFSGNPCSIQSFSNTDFTSTVTAYFSDSNGFFKDTGTLSAPQQGGCFPPQFPVQAQSQQPSTLAVLDNYVNGTSGYVFSGILGGTVPQYVNTTLTSAVTSTGIQAVTVADPTQPGLFQLLTVDTGANQETVLVLLVTPTGFVAKFTKVHTSGVPVTSLSLSVTVPASTTATISLTFGSKPIPSSETVYGNQSDYIGLYLYVSDPSQIQSVTLKFDCGDGSFNSDYFYKVIAQGPLQNLVSQATTSTGWDLFTALTDATLSENLNLYGNQAGGVAELNTGLANWTPLLFQLSDFSGSGRADYTDPVYNWANVNGYQITIVTNVSTSVSVTGFTGYGLGGGPGVLSFTEGNNFAAGQKVNFSGFTGFAASLNGTSGTVSSVGLSSSAFEVDVPSIPLGSSSGIVTNGTGVTANLAALVLLGGAGPDTLGGVAYDYVWTFLNPVDGTESNPSPIMTNQNPPNQTNWVYPRRQPVLLNMDVTTYGPAGQLQDGQIGYARIYRRGGTLGDNFRRVDQIPITIAAGGIVQYTDTAPDYQIAGAPFVSFTNDVPVPSLLPVPVNTTLQNAISTAGQVVTVTPVSMANISVRQQVTLGSPTAIENNFETVVVLTIGANSFTAFVQNTHSAGEQVQASIKVGQPVNGMVIAFGKAWYWGDPNNPSTLYFSTGNAPQYVGQANNVIISTPDDYITAVAPYKGNIFVSCIKSGWWMLPPENPAGQPPYPTACRHGCVAPFGFVATEEMIAYQAADGLRAFAGGASQYMSLPIEFIFQGIGSTPIVEADQTQLSKTVAAYWNSMIFFSYVGTDGNRHRVIAHSEYKRFRNDDVDAQCLMLEADTNQLLYGDSNGLVHIDRQNLPYDQVNVGGLLAAGPIAMNLQTAYSFQGSPANQKQYNAVQVDCNTNGQTLAVNLLFNDGDITLPLGTISNTQRGKINLPVNLGEGQQAYKVSLQIIGSVTEFSYLYQAAIECLVLPRTRKTFDSYDLNLGGSDSKFARDVFFQYSAQAAITVNVYYDSNPTPGFTFTMPLAGGIRNPLRQRLPAVSFRTIRFVGTSTEDFLFWPDSALWYKFQCQGRGYEKAMFIEP